jgi:hypothetical protein
VSKSIQEQLSELREQIDRRNLTDQAMDKQIQDLEYVIREKQREKMLRDKWNRLTGETNA